MKIQVTVIRRNPRTNVDDRADVTDQLVGRSIVEQLHMITGWALEGQRLTLDISPDQI